MQTVLLVGGARPTAMARAFLSGREAREGLRARCVFASFAVGNDIARLLLRGARHTPRPHPAEIAAALVAGALSSCKRSSRIFTWLFAAGGAVPLLCPQQEPFSSQEGASLAVTQRNPLTMQALPRPIRPSWPGSEHFHLQPQHRLPQTSSRSRLGFPRSLYRST